MKNRNNRGVLLAILIILFVVISICAFVHSYNHTLPKEANATLERYMEAFKIGTVEAAQYAYFENEEIKATYIGAGTILVDYIVEGITRINGELFALTILVKTNRTGDSYLRVYNFLGYIENSWKFMNGIGNVPEELSDGLNREDYMYKRNDTAN